MRKAIIIVDGLKWALMFVRKLWVLTELYKWDNFKHVLIISARVPFVITGSVCRNLSLKIKEIPPKTASEFLKSLSVRFTASTWWWCSMTHGTFVPYNTAVSLHSTQRVSLIHLYGYALIRFPNWTHSNNYSYPLNKGIYRSMNITCHKYFAKKWSLEPNGMCCTARKGIHLNIDNHHNL